MHNHDTAIEPVRVAQFMSGKLKSPITITGS